MISILHLMSGCKSVWARGAIARGRTIGRGEALTSSLISPLPKFLPLALPLSLPSPLCCAPFYPKQNACCKRNAIRGKGMRKAGVWGRKPKGEGGLSIVRCAAPRPLWVVTPTFRG